VTDKVLLQDGFALLQEDGFDLLQEATVDNQILQEDGFGIFQEDGSSFLILSDTSVVVVPSISLSGPSDGSADVASSNFTVQITNPSGSVIFIPTSSAGTGTFSPSSLTLSQAQSTQTFTYTPTSGGARAIGGSNDGGATGPTPVTFNVAYTMPAVTAAVTAYAPTANFTSGFNSAWVINANRRARSLC
jgi:hypothetical protein